MPNQAAGDPFSSFKSRMGRRLPNATTYVAFLAAVLSMQLLPGPETMLVVSRGIGQGRKVAF